MKRHLLLDRTQAGRLLYPLLASVTKRDEQARAFLELCQRYQTVYIEEIGASGLEKALTERCADFPDVISVPRFVDLHLSRKEEVSLKKIIASPRDEVHEALRRFQQEKGGRPRERDEVLGYATRLILLGRLLDADLLCWPPRANVILALLDASRAADDDVASSSYLRREGNISKLAPSFSGAIGVLLPAPMPPAPSDAETSLPSPPIQKHTILFLSANPGETDRLALDREARAIQGELERSGHRDCFKFETRWAVEPLDLLRELRKLKPTVVHFSGHGGRSVGGEPSYGLFLCGPDGRAQPVSAAAITEAFGAAGASVKLVVLNACYTEVQAKALLTHVDCVVGMGDSIHDDAARNFAIGFYGGLGEHEPVAAAYRQGCAAIRLQGLPDGDRPQLKVRAGVDASRLVLAADSR